MPYTPHVDQPGNALGSVWHICSEAAAATMLASRECVQLYQLQPAVAVAVVPAAARYDALLGQVSCLMMYTLSEITFSLSMFLFQFHRA